MEINEIIKPENLVYGKPRLMNENPMHYCRNAWDVRNAVPPCLLYLYLIGQTQPLL